MPVMTAVFEPLGPLAFGNGMPFTAGDDHFRSTAAVPWPTVTTGALAAALVRNPRYVRGPLLATRDDAGTVTLRFPLPLDLVRSDEVGWVALDWSAGDWVVPGVDGGEAPVRVPAGAGDPAPELGVTSGELARYLSGRSQQLLTSLTRTESLRRHWQAEERVGLAKGRPGMLYSTEMVRLGATREPAGRTVLACVIETQAGDIRQPVVRLGAEGGVVSALVLPDCPKLPEAPQLSGRRLLLYLATPAVFDRGWRPNLPPGARIVGACIRGPLPVPSGGPPVGAGSHWQMRWAVAAGSVYVVEFPDADKAQAYARTVHGRCLGAAPRTIQTAGFGWAFVGQPPWDEE